MLYDDDDDNDDDKKYIIPCSFKNKTVLQTEHRQSI